MLKYWELVAGLVLMVAFVAVLLMTVRPDPPARATSRPATISSGAHRIEFTIPPGARSVTQQVVVGPDGIRSASVTIE